MKALYTLLMTLALVSCVSNPNAQKAQTARSIGYLSDQIDRAELNGWITNEKEDELQNRLLKALDLLDGHNAVTDIIGCTAGDSDSQCIDRVLRDIERELRQ